MALKILKGSEVKPSTVGIKCLLYGNSGTGKTYLLSSVKNAFYIDTEGGVTGGRGLDESCAYVHITTYSEFEEAIRLYENELKSQYPNLVIDSFTQLEVLLKAEKIENKGGAMLRINDYGEIFNELFVQIQKLRDLSKNFFLSCRAKEGGIEDYQYFVPELMSKVEKQLVALMDFVGFVQVVKMSDGQFKRVLTFDIVPYALTKARTGMITPKKLTFELAPDTTLQTVFEEMGVK